MPVDKNALADQIDREVARIEKLQDLSNELRELGGLEGAHATWTKRIDDLKSQAAEIQTSIAKHQDDDKALMDTLGKRRQEAEAAAAEVRSAADAYSAAKRGEADQIAVSARNEADRIMDKARKDAQALTDKTHAAIANFKALAGSGE